MSSDDRRHDILEQLLAHGTVQSTDIERRHKVSRMTVHRDLDALVAEGWAARVRGGITVSGDPSFESDYRFRAMQSLPEKARMAEAASALVKDGMTVGLGYGSTVATVVPHLAQRSGVTVVTGSLPIIEAVAQIPQINLVVVGGTLIRRFAGLFGPSAEDAYKTLSLDLCILSSAAATLPDVFHPDERVVAAKRGLLKAANKSVLMMGHSKLNGRALHRLCGLDEIDTLITDAPLSDQAPIEETQIIVA